VRLHIDAEEGEGASDLVPRRATPDGVQQRIEPLEELLVLLVELRDAHDERRVPGECHRTAYRSG
jgi:hypothetical protein